LALPLTVGAAKLADVVSAEGVALALPLTVAVGKLADVWSVDGVTTTDVEGE